jgi:hypothetical protein
MTLEREQPLTFELRERFTNRSATHAEKFRERRFTQPLTGREPTAHDRRAQSIDDILTQTAPRRKQTHRTVTGDRIDASHTTSKGDESVNC